MHNPLRPNFKSATYSIKEAQKILNKFLKTQKRIPPGSNPKYLTPQTDPYLNSKPTPESKLFLGLLTRCKDEPYVHEWAQYYLDEGVDKIYIIDDNSLNKSIYDKITSDKVTVIFAKNINIGGYSSKFFNHFLRDKFTWLIYNDVDEYITTRKNPNNTIRKELETTFSSRPSQPSPDCIRIPWVMMASNNIKHNPESLLKTNIYRWNHDKRHPNPLPHIKKFRCRYDEIEVKSIFKPNKYTQIKDHIPSDNTVPVRTVDGVYNKPINTYRYQNLREKDIKNAYFVCHHYRVVSLENNINKLRTNVHYIRWGVTLRDFQLTDHSEIQDETIKNRIEDRESSS